MGKGKKGERGGEEREWEGDTCNTNPILLPAPLDPASNCMLLGLKRVERKEAGKA